MTNVDTETTSAETPTPIAGEGDAIVHLTDIAAAKVVEIREAEGIEKEKSLRVRVVGGGCAGFSYDLYFDEASDLDKKFTVNGVDIAVDEMSLMYMVGTTIDYVETLQGAGFKFDNPNIKSTCGCGSSFGV